MNYPRAKYLDSGVAMVVTDLHGDGEMYATVKERFLEHKAAGEADYLVICGDLIHGYGKLDDDYSINMVMDVIKLQQEFGDDNVIMLMGNHELPHVYNVTLSKGNMEFTARFEQFVTASGNRNKVFDLFINLPLYVFTKAGVMLTHAGATHVISSRDEAEHILTFDHKALIKLADDRLRNGYDISRLGEDKNYLRQAMHFTGVTAADDSRLTHLLRGQLISQTMPEFQFLWDTLFTRNEQGSSVNAYNYVAQFFLRALSHFTPTEQRVIVAGHLPVRGGHEIVGDHQLRLASATHANPTVDGQYLLLDCSAPIQCPNELLPCLRHVVD